MTDETKIKSRLYPRGLFFGAAVNACNMAGLGMLNALLVLYCTRHLHISVQDSYSIYAAFGALFYSTALLGGFLGGRYDYKLATSLGCLLAGVGSYFLAINGKSTMFMGLSCFIMGCSLIIPNLYCIIGKLYAKDDHNRDSGFTIVYSLTNLGAAIMAFAAGFIAENISYHIAFFIMASILLFSLFLFLGYYHRFDFYSDSETKPYASHFSWSNLFQLIVIIAITLPILNMLLRQSKISNILLLILGVIMILVVIFLAFREEIKERIKLLTFLTFIIIGVVFWALYMLAPSALTIFIQHNVIRNIGHLTIPAGSFYSLNPLFIILLGPLVSFVLLWFTKKQINFPLPAKFSFGIVNMGLGYITLIIGIYFANKSGFIAMGWIILSYFFQSFGELFIGPTSYAMVGKLCPIHLEGFMMGMFRLSTGVAGALSGFLAAGTITEQHKSLLPLFTNPQFRHAFGLYGSITIVLGLLVLGFLPLFKKLNNKNPTS